ncbi:MAG TPA: hypothetical protein VIU37_01635 [Candidatus Limnocylindrales bacterium]
MTDDTPIRPFLAFLQDHRAGACTRELTEALHEVVQAVVATGKPGSVTLTLNIQPLKDAASVLKVTDAVRSKVPELARPAAIYFPDRAGNLSRENPDQPMFEGMRVLEGERPRDVRELAAGDRD